MEFPDPGSANSALLRLNGKGVPGSKPVSLVVSSNVIYLFKYMGVIIHNWADFIQNYSPDWSLRTTKINQ